MPLIEATIIPEDVQIIQSLAVSRFGRPDSNGWHFTNNGRYTVKSGYMVGQLHPEKNTENIIFGPTITSLQARVWKIRCPPKVQHFIWQALSGGVSVAKNLRARGIDCDIQCARCGAEEETINHVLFECPPAIQTWALSRIPSNPDIFPASSLFTNMDYLLSRLPHNSPNGFFPWIIWFLWKSRNDKIFKNLDRDPQRILMLAETEGEVWEQAQVTQELRHNSVTGIRIDLLEGDTWWCQIDGSWKEFDKFSGQGWVCTKPGTEEILLGARNTLPSQSPLHAELEALLWAMECMTAYQRKQVAFATDCADLVKMVSSPENWPAFSVHLDELRLCKRNFDSVRISHIPRTANTRADKLAKDARRRSSEMVYIDTVQPIWEDRASS